MKPALARRATIAELRWPQTPEFLDVAVSIDAGSLSLMLEALWQGYDRLASEVLAHISFEEPGDEAERTITSLLHQRVQESLSGEAPFLCRHAQRENESRLAAPAQAPEYDIAFVLRDNERIAWPVEAKVLKTDRTISAYVAEVRDQFLTCRYAPFSRSGAMVGYLFAGDPIIFLQNVAAALDVEMKLYEPASDRPHRYTNHEREVPAGRPYPTSFECHHLVMQMKASANSAG